MSHSAGEARAEEGMPPPFAELLAELAGIFPDRYMHLGGDEVDGQCWLSDADIAAWASKRRRSVDWKLELQAVDLAAQVGHVGREQKRRTLCSHGRPRRRADSEDRAPHQARREHVKR